MNSVVWQHYFMSYINARKNKHLNRNDDNNNDNIKKKNR